MKRVFFVGTLLLTGVSICPGVGLRGGLERFVELCGRGEWRAAGDVWLEMASTYGGEPEWLLCVERFREAAVLSLLFSGRPAEALAIVEGETAHQSAGGGSLWLKWLHAVALEAIGRSEDAGDMYDAVAAESDDRAIVMLSRLRAAVGRRSEHELKELAEDKQSFSSLSHAAAFHRAMLLMDEGRCLEAAEQLLRSNAGIDVIVRPGLWELVMRNCVVRCREQEANGLASLVADRLMAPESLLRHIQLRRRILQETMPQRDGTLRGNIRFEYMWRMWAGLGEEEQLVGEWIPDWDRFCLMLAELYLDAGRPIEAEVLFDDLYRRNGVGNVAERALLGLVAVAVEEDSGDIVNSAMSRYCNAFQNGELRGEATALFAWWCFRRGLNETVREIVHDYLKEVPAAADKQPRLLLLSAHAAIRLGYIAEARADLERLLTGGDRQAVGRARLALALCCALDGDLNGALESLATLRSEPALTPALRAEVFREELRVLQLVARWRDALALIGQYRRELEADVPWPELPLWEGDVQLQLGDPLAAERCYAMIRPEAGSVYSAAVVRRARLLQQTAAWRKLESLLCGAFEGGALRDSVHAVEALWLWMHAVNQQGNDCQWQPVYDRWIPQVLALPPDVETLPLWRRLTSAGWFGDDLRAMDEWFGEQLDKPEMQSDCLAAGRLLAAWAECRKMHGRMEGALELICRWAPKLEPDLLAADALTSIGRSLAEGDDPLAIGYMTSIDRRFPSSPHRAVADVYFGEQAMKLGDYSQARQRFSRAQTRAHDPNVAFGAVAGMAVVAHRSGNADEGIALLEGALRDRRFRGRNHARALLLLAELCRDIGDMDRSTGYLHRLVLLYGSHRDLVAEAEKQLHGVSATGPDGRDRKAG